MYSSSLFCIETSKTSALPLIPTQKRNVLKPLTFNSCSTSVSETSQSPKSSSLALSDLSFSDQGDHSSSVRKCSIKLWKSQCFVEILKQLYLLHKDVQPFHIAKLQLLNRKCYDYFVPQVMASLKLKMEMPPCLLSSLEPDVQAIINEKKSEGVKIRTAHVLTLRFDESFKSKQQVDKFMAKYLTEHPVLARTYSWTGEHWQVLHKKHCRSTVFRFVSVNK